MADGINLYPANVENMVSY